MIEHIRACHRNGVRTLALFVLVLVLLLVLEIYVKSEDEDDDEHENAGGAVIVAAVSGHHSVQNSASHGLAMPEDEIADAQLLIAVGRRAYRLASSKCRRARAFPG